MEEYFTANLANLANFYGYVMGEKVMGEEFDSPWKTVLDKYFREFMALLFPEAAAGIDWCDRLGDGFASGIGGAILD